MSKLSSIALIVAVFCVVGFEIQQVFATCDCMCHAKSGLPSSVTINDTGACDRDFSYTYKLHYATNDDSACGTGIAFLAFAYVNSPTVNVQNHAISPISFTVTGAGKTQLFMVSGELFQQHSDGVSATTVYGPNGSCVEDSLVTLTHDPQCP